MKNIYTWSAQPAKRTLTVADLKSAKGKKKFTQVTANTTDEAIQLYNQFKRLEDAGAFAAECEVIPENVMGEISKRTNVVTVSLGAGKNADVMYLFMEDICGDTENLPRHSKAYGNLLKLRNEIKIERVRALKAFRKDSMSGKFPGKKQSSNLEKIQFEEFLNKLD
jgi:3-methyl-2-oxobutanoate hydroxymethyltransferase